MQYSTVPGNCQFSIHMTSGQVSNFGVVNSFHTCVSTTTRARIRARARARAHSQCVTSGIPLGIKIAFVLVLILSV